MGIHDRSSSSALAPRTPRERSHDLLSRVLDEPQLVQAVRALPPGRLGALVQHIGLEDAGELVALATAEQLGALLDADLWTHERIGQDEAFDAARFATWLEVMLEAGEEAVADKLVELPDELVTLGFHSMLIVLDMDALGRQLARQDDDEVEQIEKALDSAPCEELEEFRIIARKHEGWDAVLNVILALDKSHHAYLTRLLERLAHASSEWIDDQGGLYEALTGDEMIASDAAADREDRRARQGHVSPAMARSFLATCGTDDAEAVLAERARDPLATAYFRELGDEPVAHATEAPLPRSLLELLRAADVDDGLPLRLLEAPKGAKAFDPFREAMRALSERDPELHARRLEELVFVANVLIAGVARDGRALRTIEAVELAIDACNAALKRLTKGKRTAEQLLASCPTERLFRIGYRAGPPGS